MSTTTTPTPTTPGADEQPSEPTSLENFPNLHLQNSSHHSATNYTYSYSYTHSTPPPPPATTAAAAATKTTPTSAVIPTSTKMDHSNSSSSDGMTASSRDYASAAWTIGAIVHDVTAMPSRSCRSMYHDRLLNQPSTSVEAVLAAACDAMGFDIAEMWLRTGPKTHQLTNTHLRPAALEDRVTNELVEVYYGEKSAERTHKLSPALCKRAKEAMDVVWVTSGVNGADGNALKCSISDVKTAVAVPVCHESSNTNITLIFFSLKRAMMRPPAIEFLVHMSLAAAVASANDLEDDVFNIRGEQNVVGVSAGSSMSPYLNVSLGGANTRLSRSMGGAHPASHQMQRHTSPLSPSNLKPKISVTGANLDMKWNSLQNVEYLTDGGNSWIHTAVVNGKSVVVKTLKPECQDMALAINEIEGELEIHSKLNHEHIVSLIGAGLTSKGVRFVVLERLDGGTLTQVLGYDTRIRDRRRRFFKRKQLSYLEVLSHARSLADSLAYCHGRALPGSLVLHRDVKPDNIGFTLDGTLKLIDFGLAKVVENASPDCNDVYRLSGETGSLRYMAPEVADNRPYNHKADVYSFAIILWEMLSYKKPYDGLNRETFYIRIVDGGERPPINKKWPKELSKLITDCWSNDIDQRPTFSIIVDRLTNIINSEKGGRKMKVISALIDRHSTWF